VWPEREVHLVEPLKKRARLLAEVAAELGLANVRVHAVRAEEAGRGELRESCALVVARAVAELRVLLEYTAPLAMPGGVLALAKGSGVKAEVEVARHAAEVLSCGGLRVTPMRSEVNALASIVLAEKVGRTVEGYPRRPGMPEKRPL
jgi:16S rRNA (guanine527-N7)-methyltransferase